MSSTSKISNIAKFCGVCGKILDQFYGYHELDQLIITNLQILQTNFKTSLRGEKWGIRDVMSEVNQMVPRNLLYWITKFYCNHNYYSIQLKQNCQRQHINYANLFSWSFKSHEMEVSNSINE